MKTRNLTEAKKKFYLRVITLIILIFSAIAGHSQPIRLLTDTFETGNEKYYLLRSTYNNLKTSADDSTVFYLTNNKFVPLLRLNTTDILPTDEEIDYSDSIRVTDLILNKKTKGIILKWRYNTSASGWEKEFQRVQIWNLQTKQLLFDIYPYFSSYGTHQELVDDSLTEVSTSCISIYNLCICSDGTVSVEPVEFSEEGNCNEKYKYYHALGTFKFKKGEYIKVD